jgi:hypothetical protein
MELLLHFWCLENLPVPHIETLITSKFIVNSPLLVLNIWFSLLLAFQQNWFHLIWSFLAKVIWFLDCPFRASFHDYHSYCGSFHRHGGLVFMTIIPIVAVPL